MNAKYTIVYSQPFRKNSKLDYYYTDDPVACEDYLEHLLDRGVLIRAVRHDGVDLPRHEFDRLVKIGACKLASGRLCRSLGIEIEEEHSRFGFSS